MTETIPYIQYSAQGNDFLVIDGEQWSPLESQSQIKDWTASIREIGWDQLLIVDLDRTAKQVAVQIHNADGSVAEQCGNGMRAVVQFLHETHRDLDPTDLTLQPPAGKVLVKEARFTSPGKAWVHVALPGPSNIELLRPPPASLATESVGLSLGNPHWVLFWPHEPTKQECQEIGLALQNHSNFPNGVNVGLAHWDGMAIQLRVYERGVGPTMACGSGACASAIALLSQTSAPSTLKVHQPGGEVMVHWPDPRTSGNFIELAGDVMRLGQGQLPGINTL